MNVNRIFAWILLLAAPLPAAAQGISINLPISLPGITADLTATFEEVAGLSAANLGITSSLVSPLNLGLLARLPPGVSIPISFPVLVRIEPRPESGFTFTGVTSVEIHSLTFLLLQYLPLRLYSAPLGGRFTDTTTSGPNTRSYRVSGSKGGFSEFLVVVDLTGLNQVITGKLNALDQILTDNAGAIAEPLRSELVAQVATTRAHYVLGDGAAAINDVDLFLATVLEHSGADIPDLWSATRDRVNVAGLLRAEGMTLEFSLKKIPGL